MANIVPKMARTLISFHDEYQGILCLLYPWLITQKYGVCRTAPATTGLLKTLVSKKINTIMVFLSKEGDEFVTERQN